MQAPYEEHMEAVNRILRYLETTPRKGLMLKKKKRKTIKAYTTQTGQHLLLTGNLPPVTVHLYGTIL